MDFCIGTTAKIDAVGLVKQAEDVGASHFGVGEGPLLFSDPYQYLALAARETSTIKLGTWVTNPLTRIAPVTANSIATLNALAPGRTFLGIGTANNALRSMGNRPAKLSELDSALTITRGLLAGERVTQTWLGQEREIEFLDRNGYWYNIDAPVDVWMSAGGPKGFALAAKHADYMTYCLGPNPEMIGVVRRELDKAVAEAGRPPGSVKLVALSWFYQLRDGETWEDGVDHGFGSGPISSCITNAGFMNDHVDELGERIVTASTAGREGLPRRPHRTRRPALPRGVGEVPARPRPRPPAADHQGTRRLLVPLRQPRRAAGEDPAHARGRLRHGLGLPVQPVHRRARHRRHRLVDPRPRLTADSKETNRP